DEGIAAGIVVLARERLLQFVGMQVAAGGQFQQMVAAAADQLGQLLVAGAGFGQQRLEFLIAVVVAAGVFFGQFGQRRAVAAQQFAAVGGAVAERIHALVVPARQHVLGAVGHGDDVDGDVVLLADAVEPADA